MEKCIYCNENEAGSSEHILQNALGADWERKDILCYSCNLLFGNTIDRLIGDEFLFFRNGFGITGKHDNLRNVAFTDANGEKVERDGKKGIFIGAKKPVVTREIISDKCYRQQVETDITKYPGIEQGIKKRASKNGDKVGKPVLTAFEAVPPGNLAHHTAFSVASWIALRKSLINFWRSSLTKPNQAILEVGSPIRKFASMLENNTSTKDLAAYAVDKGIGSFPMSVSVSPDAETKIAGNSQLYHALILTPKDEAFYGCVILFNSMKFGFKLCKGHNHGLNKTVGYRFQLGVNGAKSRHLAIEGLSGSDFCFTPTSNEMAIDFLREQICQAMPLCLAYAHLAEVKSALDPTRFEGFFPITDQKILLDIIAELAVYILGLELTKAGYPPHIVRTGGEWDVLPVETAKTILQEAGSSFALTKDTWHRVVVSLFAWAGSMSNFLIKLLTGIGNPTTHNI